MKGTKEFYDIMEAFERYVKSDACPYIGCTIERADKNAKHFYENGRLNQMFIVYMAGNANAKYTYQ